MRPSSLARVIPHVWRSKRALMLYGPPGIGKSQIVRQCCDEDDLELIDLRLTQMDPVDLRGLPSVKEGVTRWNRPSFMPTEGRGVILLDELPQSPPLMQAAALQLMLDRRLGDFAIPDDWFVMGAGNRQEDRAGTHRLITPLLNRMIHLDMEVSHDDWHSWAIQSGIHGGVRSYLRFKAGSLHDFDPARGERAFATPRSWEMLSDVLKTEPPSDAIMPLAIGTVGDGHGAEFVAYLEIYNDLPDMDYLLKNPGKVTIPESKPAVLWAICGTLTERSRDMTDLGPIAIYGQRLPEEFSALLLRDIMAANATRNTSKAVAPAPKCVTGGMARWISQHREIVLTSN